MTGKSFSRLLFALLIALISLIVVSCGSGGNKSSDSSDSSSVTLNLGSRSGNRVSDAIPSNVATIKFTISGPEGILITRTVNVAGLTSITETFEVPNGTARTFLVEALDSNGVVLYSGSATADLDGTPISVGISMAMAMTQEQYALYGVNAATEEFKNTINQKGYLLAPSDLLRFYDVNYMEDGLDRFAEASNSASDLAGDNFIALSATRAVSYDAASNIIAATVFYDVIHGDGMRETGTFEEVFILDASSGKWVNYGNQRIGDFSVWFGTRRGMTASGSTDTVIWHSHIQAPQGVILGAVMSGPAVPTVNFNTTCGSETKGGVVFDRFCLSSGQNQGTATSAPKAGDIYTFAVTKADNSTVNYTQTLTTVLLDAVNITSPSAYTLADANLGGTLNVSWAVPPWLINADSIMMQGNVCGPTGSQMATGTVTGLTSGSINLPSLGGGEYGAYIDVRVHQEPYVFTDTIYQFGAGCPY